MKRCPTPQGNASYSYNETLPHTYYNTVIKNKTVPGAGEDVGKTPQALLASGDVKSSAGLENVSCKFIIRWRTSAPDVYSQ